MRTTFLQEKKRKRDEELIVDRMKHLIITKKLGKVDEQLPDIKTILYNDPPAIIPKSTLNPEYSQLILFSPQKPLVSEAEESEGNQREQERTQRNGTAEKIMPMFLDALADFRSNPSSKRQKDNSGMSMDLD